MKYVYHLIFFSFIGQDQIEKIKNNIKKIENIQT